jgi:hypothetical protein
MATAIARKVSPSQAEAVSSKSPPQNSHGVSKALREAKLNRDIRRAVRKAELIMAESRLFPYNQPERMLRRPRSAKLI